MDEWTGRLDTARFAALGEALRAAAGVGVDALGDPS